MILESLKEFFIRDIENVKKEITLYADESDLWKTAPGINNSAGNLALHLTGNLKYFIGVVLGKSEYIREREKEFTLKNIPREEIFRGLDETNVIIRQVFDSLQETDLNQPYPENLNQKKGDISYQLIRLLAHLNYHLGQINYHRRLLAFSSSDNNGKL